jgi:hypothetical protein
MYLPLSKRRVSKVARKNILAKPYPFSCDLSEQHTNCCPSQKLRSVDYGGVGYVLTTI